MILMAIDLSNISGLSVSICLAAVLPNDNNNKSVDCDFGSRLSSCVRPDFRRPFSQLSTETPIQAAPNSLDGQINYNIRISFQELEPKNRKNKRRYSSPDSDSRLYVACLLWPKNYLHLLGCSGLHYRRRCNP